MLRYCVTIFLGAFLLFVVQPLMGRLMLPSFGGVAIVWTTSVLMFQTLLLAGYCWAHMLRLVFSPRAGMLVHAALLIGSAFLLPLALPDGLQIDPDESVSRQVAWILLFSVGPPFALLSATSPLLQAWQTASHPNSSPYRMYALSNVGSMLGLLGYPLVIESTLGLSTQTRWWSVAFVFYVLTLVWSGRLVWRLKSWPEKSDEDDRLAGKLPNGKSVTRGVWWIGLTAIASGLMLATSTVLCQEIASFPFLWVLPLAAYLVAWIVAFEKPGWYSRRAVHTGLIFFGVAGLVLWHLGTTVSISIHMVVLPLLVFAGSWGCLGELERSKPHPRHLTMYWMLTGVGGLIGGFLVVVIAPILFQGYFEFHVFLGLAIVVGAVAISRELLQKEKRLGWRLGGWFFTGLLALVVIGASFFQINSVARDAGMKFLVRTDYGMVSVWEADGYRSIVNGQTMHGRQKLDKPLQFEPRDYYAPDRGVGLAMRALRERKKRKGESGAKDGMRIGVIGLGSGCLTAWAGEGDTIRFYELNPEVVRVAWDWFSWLPHAREQGTLDGNVIVGDARVRLEQEFANTGSHQFDILVVDAFTSDSIPAHLLTDECQKMYWQHLRPDGILAIHITNRNIDLRGVLVNNSADATHQSLLFEHPNVAKDDFGCTWVLMGLREVINESGLTARSTPWPKDVVPVPWTDDFNCVMWLVEWTPEISPIPAKFSKPGSGNTRGDWP